MSKVPPDTSTALPPAPAVLETVLASVVDPCVETSVKPAIEPAAQPVQERLFSFENPLKKRFGKEFFSQIPRDPGVYTFKGEQGEILYIGKAKDLRARLQSYHRARPEQVSRKVIRMIHLIRKIEWELCESEEAALLRENFLLRTHQPPFNVVNTHPESYYFIGFGRQGRSFRFRLTTRSEIPEAKNHQELFKVAEPSAAERLFGTFKGRGSIRSGYSALLRLFWATQAESDRFDYPAALTRHHPAYRYELQFAEAHAEEEMLRWERLLRRFLSGTSRVLLAHLTERLLANESIPRFAYHCIQKDLETLEWFYAVGPHRNRKVKRHHRIGSTRLIAQNEIDDLLVGYRMKA